MPLDPETVAVLHALADPVRIRILDQLAKAPSGVAELSRHLPITRQGTAKHVAILREAGLLLAQPSARTMRYEVSTANVRAAASYLTESADRWSRQLQLLKSTAEELETDEAAAAASASPDDL